MTYKESRKSNVAGYKTESIRWLMYRLCDINSIASKNSHEIVHFRDRH